MKTEEYNRKDLTDYLLGKSSESDADSFDELSITDDDFADALKSAEDELIDSYLRGELIDTDVGRFEASYLASPLRREKVEFARALQVVAEKNRVTISQVSEKKTWAEFFAFLNFNPALRYGFAALLLAFAAIFVWFLLRQNEQIDVVKVEPTPTHTIQPTQTQTPTEITPSPTVSPKAPTPEKTAEPKASPTISPTPKPTAEPTKAPTPTIPTLATFVLLPPTRGTGNFQTISVPANTSDVAFNLPLESDDFKTYSVKLTNQSGKVLWQSGKLSSKKSALNVRFPANLLQSNIYSFTVSGKNNAEDTQNIGNYSFKSVIK
jgi:cell division septation protein DedD